MASDVDRLGLRIQVLRLAGALGREKSYGVSFCENGDDSTFRPLSIIAGPSQTGKTSTIDFIRYCLGGGDLPQHPEIVAAVRSAVLEVQLGRDRVSTIERSAAGSESRFATVWPLSLGELDSRGAHDLAALEVRRSTDLPADPEGLSQVVLAACGLDGISLPQAPTQTESRTQAFSIRDLFRLIWLPNERLDSKNLLFEHGNYMVAQKFRQTIDAIFNVHDVNASSLAAELHAASEAAQQAARDAENLRSVVQQEHPVGELVLETDRDQIAAEISQLTAQLQQYDSEQFSQEQHVEDLRQQVMTAEREAHDAAIRVRDRESLLGRLAALRGQYADDKKKLTFLKDAERLFDPLRVVTCPACFTELAESPNSADGSCSLCGTDLTRPSTLDEDAQSGSDAATPEDVDDTIAEESDGTVLLEAELRATSRRLDDLTDYWSRLDRDLRRLQDDEAEKSSEVDAAAAALDSLTRVPAPFLAIRDDLNRRITEARLRIQRVEAGLRLWGRVRNAEERSVRLSARAERLRQERRESAARPDRANVIRQLSDRFGGVLADLGYPKLSEARIDERYFPYVRGMPYSAASSGGQTLIALAWYLSILEVSYEQDARAPGLLMIDSPQKNLGHAAGADDQDFADARLVDNFYRHVKSWLASDGAGAQIIVIDNSPPAAVSNDVVVRYTRDRQRPPYGLIDDAID